jgi:hypothetical protein
MQAGITGHARKSTAPHWPEIAAAAELTRYCAKLWLAITRQVACTVARLGTAPVVSLIWLDDNFKVHGLIFAVWEADAYIAG